MRRLITGLFIIALAWAGGLLAFISGLPHPYENGGTEGHGVAVYTGGGGKRIAAGMALFADGAGERLLITGVHPDTTRARLAEMWRGPRGQFDCCVDLDRKALSTDGNAKELKAWADAHAYKEIILVTSEYHMPRAVAATRAQMPDAALKPYPVASGYLDDDGRPVSLEAWEKLAGEYIKYLLARVKAVF